MISLKDYAREAGVTYEAVRQQVKRYQNDLEGHIHLQGRTQFLDDAGVAILDSHRPPKPIAIYEAGYDRELRLKEQEVKNLEDELDKLKDELIATQKRLLLSEGAQAKLEAAEQQQQLLIEERNEYKSLAKERADDVARVSDEANQLRKENSAMAAELAKISGMGPLKRLFYKPQRG